MFELLLLHLHWILVVSFHLLKIKKIMINIRKLRTFI